MINTRKQCLNGDRCQPRSLGEAVECLVLHSRLSVAEIAARVGKSEGYLRKAANPHYDELAMQADTLLSVSLVTGNMVALRYFAGELGCMVVPVLLGAASDDAIYEAYIKAVSKIGDDGDLIRRVLSDGQLSQDEAGQVCHSVDHTMEVMAALKQAVVARAKKGQSQ